MTFIKLTHVQNLNLAWLHTVTWHTTWLPYLVITCSRALMWNNTGNARSFYSRNGMVLLVGLTQKMGVVPLLACRTVEKRVSLRCHLSGHRLDDASRRVRVCWQWIVCLCMCACHNAMTRARTWFGCCDYMIRAAGSWLLEQKTGESRLGRRVKLLCDLICAYTCWSACTRADLRVHVLICAYTCWSACDTLSPTPRGHPM